MQILSGITKTSNGLMAEMTLTNTLPTPVAANHMPVIADFMDNGACQEIRAPLVSWGSSVKVY